MTAKPTHTKTDLPPGLYADRSYLALVIRTGYKLAYYVTIDYPMRLHHLSIDQFLEKFPRHLPQYSLEEAAHRFLQTQQAETLTEEARNVLEGLTGDALLR